MHALIWRLDERNEVRYRRWLHSSNVARCFRRIAEGIQNDDGKLAINAELGLELK